MNASKPFPTQLKADRPAWLVGLGWLLALAALVFLYLTVVRPFFMEITDQSGTFTLTFSPADLDLDGDMDVLVHNRRNPGEFEAFAGGTLWINQGGRQGRQLGQFAYRINDIEGGWASTTADLDGDGDPDVLVYTGSSLVAGLNQGGQQGGQTGIFKEAHWIDPPDLRVTQFGLLIPGDLNGDGRLDVLVLGCCGRAFQFDEDTADKPNISWVWFNDTSADGRIRGHTAGLGVLENRPVTDAALADLDGDGDLDLLAVILKAAGESGPALGGVALLNDGAGSFSDSGQRLGGKGSQAVALGDLDGDGDPDALVGEAGGVSMWINQGGEQGEQAGRFAPAERKFGRQQVRSVLPADLDNDGDLDALAVGASRAEIWWNDGTGQFTRSPQSLPCGLNQDLTVGDFNGDGWADIFIAGYDKIAQVWFNDGKGKFEKGKP